MITAPSMMAEKRAPATSKRPRMIPRWTGTTRSVSSRAMTPKGRFIANNHCQPREESKAPPITGAMAVLAAMSRAWIPRIRPSKRPGKMERKMAGAILNVAAPPMPCNSRIATSISSEVDSAQPRDASVKRLIPAAKRARKPVRGASAAKMASVMAADNR